MSSEKTVAKARRGAPAPHTPHASGAHTHERHRGVHRKGHRPWPWPTISGANGPRANAWVIRGQPRQVCLDRFWRSYPARWGITFASASAEESEQRHLRSRSFMKGTPPAIFRSSVFLNRGPVARPRSPNPAKKGSCADVSGGRIQRRWRGAEEGRPGEAASMNALPTPTPLGGCSDTVGSADKSVLGKSRSQ